MSALKVHESHNIVKFQPWGDVCSRCAVKVNQSEIEKRCAANANYPHDDYDGPTWGNIPEEQIDRNEVAAPLVYPDMPQVDLPQPKGFVKPVEEMSYWVRRYWRDGLEGITEINGKAVYPSREDALEAAVHWMKVEGVPDTFRMLQEYDISEDLNVIHLDWRTGGKWKLRWDNA